MDGVGFRQSGRAAPDRRGFIPPSRSRARSRRHSALLVRLDRSLRALCTAVHQRSDVRIPALSDVRRRLDRPGLPPARKFHTRRGASRIGRGMSDFHPNARGGFLENTLEGLHSAMERALYAESAAEQKGALQGLDARVKVGGALAMVTAVALSTKLWIIGAVF